MPPKKGTRGGIEAEKMQLTKVKSRERRGDFNFVLDGEVVNRCKNIGKKWQRRVLRQKLEKRAKQLVQRWLTRTRWHRNLFLKNLTNTNKEDIFRGWATREEEAAASQVFFPYPEVSRRLQGRAETPSFKTTITDKDKISAKNIKAAKEGDEKKTEQADGGDRPG